MVNQAQPAALLRALSSQLGVSPEELKEQGRQSRLTLAATIAATGSNCQCDPCRLLRQHSAKIVRDAIQEISPPAVAAPLETVEG